jgi:hypothetical protein
MTDLKALLERVEKTTGPDRELDIDMALALNLAPAEYKFLPEQRSWQFYVFARDDVVFWTPPEWTSSLDSALALVEEKLPGFRWVRNISGGISITTDGPWYHGVPNRLANDALTMVAALLRAIMSKDGTE